MDLLKYKNLVALTLLESTHVSFSTLKRKVKSVSFKASTALMRVSHSTQGGEPVYFYYTTLLTGTILKKPNDRQGPRLDASSVDSWHALPEGGFSGVWLVRNSQQLGEGEVKKKLPEESKKTGHSNFPQD